MIKWKIYRGLDSLYRLDVNYTNNSKNLSWRGNFLKSPNWFKTIHSEEEKQKNIKIMLDIVIHKEKLSEAQNSFVAKELLDL